MLDVEKARDELNAIMINMIEETIKVADKYDIDRNLLLKQMGQKTYAATEKSDFTTYKLSK